jgi:hypothetical protein
VHLISFSGKRAASDEFQRIRKLLHGINVGPSAAEDFFFTSVLDSIFALFFLGCVSINKIKEGEEGGKEEEKEEERGRGRGRERGRGRGRGRGKEKAEETFKAYQLLQNNSRKHQKYTDSNCRKKIPHRPSLSGRPP